jgi:two-component system nitrate/nitrite sensor histidine kinase NarX
MLISARLPGKLSEKINVLLLLFFIVALCIIIATLYVGRQLQGGAAAINEAGALRMRTYQIAHLLTQTLAVAERRVPLNAEAVLVATALESALTLLEEGDSERPLFLPREAHVRAEMQALRRQWEQRLRPLLDSSLDSSDPAIRQSHVDGFDVAVRDFVPRINALVLQIEKSNARNTHLMWLFQNSLVGFALAGTLFLSYLFNLLVIRPVDHLKQGMDSMAEARFGVRLPVETRDEFGELALGFNRMADHLRDLYDNLEQRVSDKTHDIEKRNRELAALYEIAAYLSAPADIEEICRGVIDKLRLLLGADAGAVRLLDEHRDRLDIVAAVNLSADFLAAEARMPTGSCLCGMASGKGQQIVENTTARAGMLPHCRAEGLSVVAAIPIRSQNQQLGIFNLFYYGERQLSADEVRLLEAVGQNLGVAIDNRRLAVRQKDMAVSEERNLIAQELHDSIAQSLAFLNIQAQMLQTSLRAGQIAAASGELARMREGIQESYDHVRELLVHFRIRVEHADTAEAITSALEKFEAQTGIVTRFEQHGNNAEPAPGDILQILHILQEALSNVRKHAAADSVLVAMRHTAEVLSLAVSDNGHGFDPDLVTEDAGSHVGLGIMRERARRIGAGLDIDARPGHGTCITLNLPRKP